jgi:3-hydroxyisobutyrate dehydrogenase
MGAPMVRRLLAAGYPVTVFDLNAQAVTAAEALGAKPASTASAAASEADIIFVSLPTPAIVTQALTEHDGVLAGARRGAVVLDVSTIDPATARTLSYAAAEVGVTYLDSPVTGSVMGAEAGTLVFMIGGGNSETIDHLRPVLASLGRETLHMGAPGNGQIAKLCNNMMFSINLAAASEVLVAGVKAGLDLEPLSQLVRLGSGTSWALDTYMASTALKQNYNPPTFMLKLMQKDARLYIDMAKEAVVTTPLAALAGQLFEIANASGYAEQDCSSIFRVFEDLSHMNQTSPSN